MHKYISLLLLFMSFGLRGQTVVSGCVSDESGEPLIGVNVLIEGTTTGTVTDFDGCFQLTKAKVGDRIIFSYTGYESQELLLKAGATENLTIRLAVSHAVLEEVVVVGYGSAKRKRRRSKVEATSVSYDAFSAAAPASYAAPASGEGETYFSDDAPEAGQLTAGEVNDFGKWDMWEDISKEDLAEYRSVWQCYPEHRYTVQLTYAGGEPVIDAVVRLTDRDGKPVYVARTDNQGRAELWNALFSEQAPSRQLRLSTVVNGIPYQLPTATPFEQGINYFSVPQGCNRTTTVDVAFVIDATGSMGDEIRYLSSELLNVMGRAKDSLSEQTVRYTSVFYRDEGETYVTRHRQFGESMEKTIEFFRAQKADGGGDTPEAVEEALEVAIEKLHWSENAAARLLFLVLDAPPHQDANRVKKLQELAASAAKKGIRIVPVVCSGMDKSGEYLMRCLALATNGTYTFLTNHSGIGNDHLEPATDSYEVEKLNDLLVRLIVQFGQTTECGAVARSPLENNPPSETDWTAFPNPTFGPLTIEVPKSDGLILVYDNYGKLLQKHSAKDQKLRLQLGQLPSGTYQVVWERENERLTKRVVVSRA